MRIRLAVALVVGLLGLPQASQSPEVILVAGLSTYHAKYCPVLNGLPERYLRTVARSAVGAELKPCPTCRPDAPSTPVEAPSAAAVAALWSRVDPAERVSVVTGVNATGLFHRHGCPLLRDAAVQTFTRKDAEARHFQPHDCMRKAPPDGVTKAGAVSPTSGTPQRVTGGGEAPASTPQTTSPRLRDTARQQCAAITRRGTRCSRMAQPGRAYCWQHP